MTDRSLSRVWSVVVAAVAAVAAVLLGVAGPGRRVGGSRSRARAGTPVVSRSGRDASVADDGVGSRSGRARRGRARGERAARERISVSQEPSAVVIGSYRPNVFGCWHVPDGDGGCGSAASSGRNFRFL